MKSRLVFFIGLMFLLVACDSLVFNRADIKATYEIGYMHAIIDMDKSNYTYNNTALNIGSSFVAAEYLTGEIFEILIFSKAMSTDERQRVEGYLGHKYNVTLAVGHPYEDEAP